MNRTANTKRSERGSLFLVALITMLVLTLVGLSLAVVTETEMILGNNEWTSNETHYAAEAGINVQMAQLLVVADPFPVPLALPSFTTRQSGNQFGFDVRTSGMSRVATGPLQYSTANEGSAEIKYKYYFLLSRAQRTAWPAENEVPGCLDMQDNNLGSKTLMTGFYVAPIDGASSESLLAGDRASFDAVLNVTDTGFSGDDRRQREADQFVCAFEAERNILNSGTFSGTDSSGNSFDPSRTDQRTSLSTGSVTNMNNKGSAGDVIIRSSSFFYGYTG